MQDEWPQESAAALGRSALAAAVALLIHAFVLVMLVVMFLNVIALGAVYEDWELELSQRTLIVLNLAKLFQLWWYLLILPMLLDTVLVIWLALKPSRRWMLTWLNYLWLGSGLMMVTVAYGEMVSTLFRMMIKLE